MKNVNNNWVNILYIKLLIFWKDVIIWDYDEDNIVEYYDDWHHKYGNCWSTSDQRFIKNKKFNKYTQFEKISWVIEQLEWAGLSVLNKEEAMENASENKTWPLPSLPKFLKYNKSILKIKIKEELSSSRLIDIINL